MLRSIVAALAAASVLAAAHADPAAREDQVRFRWAFGAVTGTARQLIHVADDITLHTGDEIKMLVAPVTSCFVYVIHEDPKGAMMALFPEGGAFPETYKAGAQFYVPDGDGWLVLDNETGIERIYLTASPTRLPRLEAALKRNARAEVIAELSALRKQYAKADWVERPVQIGGQVRGKQGPDVRSLATELAAKTFFSRVFVIDHR